MLSEKTQAALNDQINMELSAYYTYLSMSAYFESVNLTGFAAWMYNHAQEEMLHAMKFYTFINHRFGRVILQTIKTPKTAWASPLAVFEDALAHEQRVTVAIGNLVNLARAENDHATESFLKWFVDEQVEEESLVETAIQKLKLVGDFAPGLYLLNQEMGAPAPTAAGGAEPAAG